MNRITVINEEGFKEEVEVLDIFQLEEYDHEYILYTKNEEVGDDVVTYVSILNEVGPNEFQFLRITDKEEEIKVDKKIYEEVEELLKSQN